MKKKITKAKAIINLKFMVVLKHLFYYIKIGCSSYTSFMPLNKASKKLSLCLIFVIELSSLTVHSQNLITVNGTIKDNKGESLPSVSVKLKGTPIATSTDVQGRYSIKVPNEQAVLVFTYIGFTGQEVVVGKRTRIDLALKESEASALNEVVVVAYGKVKKKDLTGSVASVNMADVNKAPVASVDQALAGRIAGVTVISPDGQPGASPEITVRGTGSVTSSSAPLYVIDGFPQEGNAFSTLNPEDIASITVLKDASSTAIYGSRGSNGVIVVTTKRGAEGVPKITYSAYYGTQAAIKQMKMMSPYDFVRLQNDISPSYASAIYFTNGRTLDYYKTAPSINWQDLVEQQAPFQNHSISLSGRSGKTNYYISGNYVNQEGLIVNSGFHRYQGRLTLDQDVAKNLRVGLTANYANTKSFGNIPSVQSQGISGTGSTQVNPQFNLDYGIWSFRPVNGGNLNTLLTSFSDDESVNTDQDRVNPLLAAQNTLNNTYTNSLSTNTYAELTFLKKFVLRSTAGITSNIIYNEFFNNSLTRAGSLTTAQGVASGLSGGVSNNYSTSFLNENTLTYNTTIHNDHNVNVLLGFTDQTASSHGNSLNAIHIPNEALGVSGIDEGTLNGIGVSSTNNTLVSFLGRVNYNYKSKYLLTASMRADGSSKFYTGHKWGYFPTGAIAWNLTEESFMKKLTFLSSTKLRASYGLTGNNRVSDFVYASPIAVSGANSASTRYSFGNTIVPGAIPTAIFNPDLKWETASQLDVGFETGILRDRFYLEMDYYKRKTSNLLLNASLPTSIGYANETQNIGTIQNEGLEISLNSTNIRTKDFTWTSNFNISFNKNKVLALSQNANTRLEFSVSQAFGADYANQPSYIAKIGQPVALFYGYVSDGLYRLADFDKIVNGTSVTYRLKPGVPYFSSATSPQPGDPKFKDLNGDGITNDQDYATIGNPYPIHYGGFNNDFRYKAFDLSIFFQWSYGNQILNGNNAVFEGLTTGDARGLGVNMFAAYSDYWTLTNDNAKYQRPLAAASQYRTINSNLIEDGSFLRLKTVQLGYNIPKKFLTRISISNLRIYTSAQNLVTWSKYSGLDPEVSTRNSPTTPGFDYSPYPRARVFVFGLNVTL